MTKVIPLTLHIKKLRKEIDSLEWEGEYKKADVLKESLRYAEEANLKGDLYYVPF